jgi:hypothetical protein
MPSMWRGVVPGWSKEDGGATLRVYDHADVAAQAEIDALYADEDREELEA